MATRPPGKTTVPSIAEVIRSAFANADRITEADLVELVGPMIAPEVALSRVRGIYLRSTPTKEPRSPVMRAMYNGDLATAIAVGRQSAARNNMKHIPGVTFTEQDGVRWYRYDPPTVCAVVTRLQRDTGAFERCGVAASILVGDQLVCGRHSTAVAHALAAIAAVDPPQPIADSVPTCDAWEFVTPFTVGRCGAVATHYHDGYLSCSGDHFDRSGGARVLWGRMARIALDRQAMTTMQYVVALLFGEHPEGLTNADIVSDTRNYDVVIQTMTKLRYRGMVVSTGHNPACYKPAFRVVHHDPYHDSEYRSSGQEVGQ